MDPPSTYHEFVRRYHDQRYSPAFENYDELPGDREIEEIAERAGKTADEFWKDVNKLAGESVRERFKHCFGHWRKGEYNAKNLALVFFNPTWICEGTFPEISEFELGGPTSTSVHPRLVLIELEQVLQLLRAAEDIEADGPGPGRVVEGFTDPFESCRQAWGDLSEPGITAKSPQSVNRLVLRVFRAVQRFGDEGERLSSVGPPPIEPAPLSKGAGPHCTVRHLIRELGRAVEWLTSYTTQYEMEVETANDLLSENLLGNEYIKTRVDNLASAAPADVVTEDERHVVRFSLRADVPKKWRDQEDPDGAPLTTEFVEEKYGLKGPFITKHRQETSGERAKFDRSALLTFRDVRTLLQIKAQGPRS